MTRIPVDNAREVASAVSGGNFARQLVVEQFLLQIFAWKDEGTIPNSLRIAVVGGSPNEPEIQALQRIVGEIEVRTFGIEEQQELLDLNDLEYRSWTCAFTPHLILCSQVLEHVWNHESAFNLLGKLSAINSRLWLATPAANRPHGSPEYFSAGFTDSFLAKNLVSRGWRVLDHGMLGSERLFVGALTTQFWLTRPGHAFPPKDAFVTGPLRMRLSVMFTRLPQTLRLLFSHPRVRHDVRYATESWVWAERL